LDHRRRCWLVKWFEKGYIYVRWVSEHTWRAGVRVPSTSKRTNFLIGRSAKLVEVISVVVGWSRTKLLWAKFEYEQQDACLPESALQQLSGQPQARGTNMAKRVSCHLIDAFKLSSRWQSVNYIDNRLWTSGSTKIQSHRNGYISTFLQGECLSCSLRVCDPSTFLSRRLTSII
jgi:hypothetical protein